MYDIGNYYNGGNHKRSCDTSERSIPEARIISGGSDVLIKIREGKTGRNVAGMYP